MTESSHTQMMLPMNGKVTEAITQSNLKVLGDAPVMAMGSLYHAMEMNINQSVQAGHLMQGSVWNAAQATQAMLHYSQSLMQYCFDPFGMSHHLMTGMSQIGSSGSE